SQVSEKPSGLGNLGLGFQNRFAGVLRAEDLHFARDGIVRNPHLYVVIKPVIDWREGGRPVYRSEVDRPGHLAETAASDGNDLARLELPIREVLCVERIPTAGEDQRKQNEQARGSTITSPSHHKGETGPPIELG